MNFLIFAFILLKSAARLPHKTDRGAELEEGSSFCGECGASV